MLVPKTDSSLPCLHSESYFFPRVMHTNFSWLEESREVRRVSRFFFLILIKYIDYLYDISYVISIYAQCILVYSLGYFLLSPFLAFFHIFLLYLQYCPFSFCGLPSLPPFLASTHEEKQTRCFLNTVLFHLTWSFPVSFTFLRIIWFYFSLWINQVYLLMGT